MLQKCLVFLCFLTFSTDVEVFAQSATLAPANLRIKGLCWAGRDSIVHANFDDVKDLISNWLSLTAYGKIDSYNSTGIYNDTSRYWWGEKEIGLIHTTELAREQGLKILLKPHLTIPREDGKWRHDIAMTSDQNWQTWFDNYKRWILDYARLAERHDMEALCIGTELYQSTKHHPDEWVEIIAAIRKVYGGQLTYAANWYQEIDDLSFWAHLDFIGVQAYYPLSRNNNPSLKELTKSWKKPKQHLKKLALEYNLPIVFTEVGYKNTSNAAVHPWTWPEENKNSDAIISPLTQKRCYEAFFRSFWDEPWFGGAFIWSWHHPTYRQLDMASYIEDRGRRMELWNSQTGNNVNPNMSFFPHDEEVLQTLSDWFEEPDKR